MIEDAGGAERWDVIVLGGGAAGLVAAIRAAEDGARVLVLEKNRRAGVKILVSGGTRCNLTNARGLRSLRGVTGPIDPGYDPRQARGARAILEAFGPQGAFLGPALRALSVESSVALFEAEGVATKIEANGKVFPASDRAVDVLEALLKRLRRSGAELQCDTPVGGIAEEEGGLAVRAGDATHRAPSVILAVGGQSYPGCGTTGDGYALARSLGHTIVEPRPALVPLRVAEGWVNDLGGVTLPDVTAAVVDASGAVRQERREAVLFAHFGLTGPAILDVSRAVARSAGEALSLRLDLVPELRAEAVDQAIQEQSRTGRRQAANLLPRTIPHRLAEGVVRAAGVALERVGPDLTRAERRALVGACKGLTIPITGTLGFAKAEVTSGGVVLDEVDPNTMASRRVPGLFFAGEVLDLDGLIGGYNFQAAWSTGWLAGQEAARRARGEVR